MGKLNSLIKFVVFNANALLFLGGLGIIVVASLFLAADFIELAQVYLQTRGIVAVAIGVLVAGMSIIGCVGTHRQIQRDQIWSGRRVLSLYQLLLVTVVVGQGLVQMKLYSIEVSLQEAAAELPEEYGDFEDRFREGFNDAYFEQLCAAAGGGEDWVWSLVATHCPESISSDKCSCSDILDGAGLPRSCSNAATYVARDCCPDEEFCEAGLEEACPYAACRPGILEALLNYITPARKYSTFVFVLEGVLLILTCLLICYNPRDSTEDILVKTGTIRRNQNQPGGANSNSKPADLEAAKRSAGGPDEDIFKLDLVQPAAIARRAAAAAARAGSGASPGRSTPSLSPMAADNAPTEPLRQFMTPRRSGNAVIHTTHSPAGNDEFSYEYQNPRKGRSAAVGPPRTAASTAITAAQRSATRGSGGAPDSAAASATTAAAVAAAAAAVGLAVGTTSTRREGAGRRSRGGGDEEEKGMDSSRWNGIVAELPPMLDQAENEAKSSGDFYDQLGAQTPVAVYGADSVETAGGVSATPRTGAGALRKHGSFDPDVFLTDVSSAQGESPPKCYPQAGGRGSFEGPPSPIVTPPTPPSGNNRSDEADKPPRFGGQTPIMTSPVAASQHDLRITVPATTGVVSGATRKVAVSAIDMPRGPPGLSAQTPVASPPRPPSLIAQTPVASPPRLPGLPAQTPVASPTGTAAPTTYQEHTAAPIDCVEIGRETAHSVPDVIATTPADTNDAVDRASSKEVTISCDTDADTGNDVRHQDEGNAIVSPRPTGSSGRFSAQTPPGGVAAGFDAPGILRAQKQHRRRGSAAYPQNGSSILPSLAADSALTAAEPVLEESSRFQTAAVEQASVRELASSAVDGDPNPSSDQAPIALQQKDGVFFLESSVLKDELPTNAAEVEPEGVKGKERGWGVGEAPVQVGGSTIDSDVSVAGDGAAAPALSPVDQANKRSPGTPSPAPAKVGDQVDDKQAKTTEAAADDAAALGSADAAVSASASSSQPRSRFARFLLKAEESLSRAQMAMSLGVETTTPARETSPAEISPPEHETAPALPIVEATPAIANSAAGVRDGAASVIVNELTAESPQEEGEE